MSGLGETISPAGEPGSGAVAPPQPETIPDNPGTIVQSTAIQTLDQLLNDNWIYQTTFSVSTSMPIGTILYYIPIHPHEWNWPNKKVAEMFNLWTGSGKIRYRPLATAWYGGSIRVGFLPPNVNVTELRQIPLSVLTSYPNRDIDPKNTAWVSFQGPDQREIAYHYMKPFDSNDRQSFGGYIVFYVAGRLVTQAPEFTSISFIVETAGNFMFDQPNPMALELNPLQDNPLGVASSVPLHLQPLLDTLASGDGLGVTVQDGSVNAIGWPGIGFAVPGKKDAILADLPSVIANSTVKSMLTRPEYSTQWHHYATVHHGYEMKPPYAMVGDPFFAQINVSVPDPSNVDKAQFGSQPYEIDTTNNDITFAFLTDKIAPGSSGFQLDRTKMLLLPSDSTVPVEAKLNTRGNDLFRITRLLPNESVVLFTDSVTRTYSIQTTLMAVEMGKFPAEADLNTSWLYNLVGPTGTPLLTLRLSPNGLFSTNAAAAAVVYPAKGATLKYIGELPLSSPLPGPTGAMLDMRRAMLKNRTMAEKLQMLTHY